MGVRSLIVLKDNMADPEWARLLHLSFDRETYERLAARMRLDADGRELLDERRTIAEDTSLDELAQLPPETLGHAYAAYYREHAIEPFSFEFGLEGDADFLNKRYRETHDIHHIVTGYGIDDLGEVELQAFYVGNLGLRHAALIALVYPPVHLVRHGPRGLGAVVGRLRAAYRRGKDSRMLLGVPFDERWDEPVAALTAELCAPA